MNLTNTWVKTSLNRNVSILAELPNSLYALNKPSGLLSHPNENDETFDKSIIYGKYDFKNEFFTSSSEDNPSLTFQSYLLHRLDKFTSGAILVTTNKEVSNIIKTQFQERKIEKEYYAVVLGNNVLRGKKSTMWKNEMEITSQKYHLKVKTQDSRDPNKRKLAQTYVKIVQSDAQSGLTLIKLTPLTGYTHQLRFQCQINNCPILGDDLYGNFQINKEFKAKKLLLHSRRIHGSYEYLGNNYSFDVEAPLPDYFLKVLKKE